MDCNTWLLLTVDNLRHQGLESDYLQPQRSLGEELRQLVMSLRSIWGKSL